MLEKLEEMCYDLNFDEEKAFGYVKQTNINDEFETTKLWDLPYTTVLLAEAVKCNNIRMVELLLKNGANPNQIYDVTESAFWNLQYEGETKEEDEIRLKTVQLFLEYGANPNIALDAEDDDLFEMALWGIFDGSEEDYCNYEFLYNYDRSWRYLSRFLILLIAYGGKTTYCVPKIIGEFDKSNMQQYRLRFLINADYRAKIIDSDKNIIAYI